MINFTFGDIYGGIIEIEDIDDFKEYLIATGELREAELGWVLN